MIKTTVFGTIGLIPLLLVSCASGPDKDGKPNRFDVDGDGYLTPDEYAASEISKVLGFEELDVDSDGLLSEAELGLRVSKERQGRGAKDGNGGRRGKGGKTRT